MKAVGVAKFWRVFLFQRSKENFMLFQYEVITKVLH